ncbi:alpha/beta fold hydrolase [Colwellia piezophila]|uniref:alpha/beta fold hydrolase n=1 Tax=Colwellia piezophila TaxID=211668 RepID=UPI00036F7337|nr:alpha/beta fold hydrolase [Colwellia piezophila]
MINKFNVITICLAFLLTSCTYLKYSAIQAEYTKLQKADPSQVNLKHMLDKETFFVWGKSIPKPNNYPNASMAIAAYSSKFKKAERVDTMFFYGTGTHYGLNLPEGVYTLLIYADINKDQMFDQSEIVGKRELVLDTTNFPDKIVKHVDIEIAASFNVVWAETILIPEIIETERSLYYPAGTIRRLDDPMFDEKISTMGMYDPASFLEYAPTMFYALKEGVAHKIPVVFVHGIGGSSRSFKAIIEHMDKNRYQAWFFYYPSGGDLDQLADFFYDIFLSGAVVPMGDMPMIVVAHSMGGLIVREAFNNYQGKEKENKVELFVSIASPLGGHPSAASGEKHGLIVLPSWRDLNPASPFIKKLYRKPLPKFVNHQLFYAYNNSDILKLGENSDGVVPLSSQLHPEAQRQSRNQFGFNSSHVDILRNEEMIFHLLKNMADVTNIFPDSHMKFLVDGGFDVKLTDDYSPLTQHLISYAGKYLMLLIKGEIKPINRQQESFIQVVKGEIAATKDVEREFIQFMREYPEMVNSVLEDQSNKTLQRINH